MRNGKLGIYADFKYLNKVVKRERYLISTLENLLHKLKLGKAFGFLQIPLQSDSAKLTTFMSTYGRYSYKRIPFGISSISEIFQLTMEDIFDKEDNVIFYFEEFLIFSEEKHVTRVFKRLQSVKLKLNKEMFEFRRKEIKFLEHFITEDETRPNPDKVEVILK